MDYLAGILELCGGWLVGNKNRWGFVCNCFGCSVWVLVAFRTGVYGLLLVVVPMFAVNCRNWWRWRDD